MSQPKKMGFMVELREYTNLLGPYRVAGCKFMLPADETQEQVGVTFYQTVDGVDYLVNLVPTMPLAEDGDVRCFCGNTPHGQGFHYCYEDGESAVDPMGNHVETKLWKCDQCGIYFDDATYTIRGRRAIEG